MMMDFDLLLLVLGQLEHGDQAAAHLVCRFWRDAVRLSTASLRLCRPGPLQVPRIHHVRSGWFFGDC